MSLSGPYVTKTVGSCTVVHGSTCVQCVGSNSKKPRGEETLLTKFWVLNLNQPVYRTPRSIELWAAGILRSQIEINMITRNDWRIPVCVPAQQQERTNLPASEDPSRNDNLVGPSQCAPNELPLSLLPPLLLRVGVGVDRPCVVVQGKECCAIYSIQRGGIDEHVYLQRVRQN